MSSADAPVPPRKKPRGVSIGRSLRVLLIASLGFVAGLFAARTMDRPVAGTLRHELPSEALVRLQQPKDLDIEEMRLDQALTQIERVYGVPLRLFEHEFKEMNIQADRPVTLKFQSANLLQVLSSLQSRYELYATWDRGGILVGGWPEIVPTHSMRIYDVEPIVKRLVGTTDHEYDAEDYAMQDIVRLVENEWPLADVQAGSNYLCVKTSNLGHEFVAMRLNDLRQALEKRR